MRRDEEIVRLTKYAQGMGLKVSFSSAKGTTWAAEWSLDGSEITIYRRQNDSKTETILSMIHEIAHHLWFIHEKNRKPDLKFEEAIGLESWKEGDKPIRKNFRKRIYEMEKASSDYWEAIYKETNIGLPKWKLYRSMEYDVWQYEVYCEHGRFPKRAERKAKRNELTAKHKALKDTYV